MDVNKIKVKRIESAGRNLIREINSILRKDKQWNKRQGSKFFNNKSNALFVAFLENKLVGFAIAYKLQRFDRKGAEVLLDEIEVIRDYRKKGIGKKIMNCIRSWAVKVGAREIWIPTNRSNQGAVALYKSIGGKAEKKDDAIFTIELKFKKHS